MLDNEQEIEIHNERELWREFALNLLVARGCLERSQAVLEDLHKPIFANHLQPLVDAIAEIEAAEWAEQ